MLVSVPSVTLVDLLTAYPETDAERKTVAGRYLRQLTETWVHADLPAAGDFQCPRPPSGGDRSYPGPDDTPRRRVGGMGGRDRTRRGRDHAYGHHRGRRGSEVLRIRRTGP